MILIVTTIDPIEVDTKEVKGVSDKSDVLRVGSHWNRNDLVILEWRGGSITVLARDLQRGIVNATNHD